MSDSSYLISRKWYLLVRFLTSSNTVSYVARTYGVNGELEFENSRVLVIPAGSFQTAPYAPTAMKLR